MNKLEDKHAKDLELLKVSSSNETSSKLASLIQLISEKECQYNNNILQIKDEYNQQIKLPTRFKHEKLYRKDSLYDIILFINYNLNPIVKNKGSAIFIHIAKKNYKPTAGCIALKKMDLIKLLGIIKRNTRIYIN